MMSASEFHNCVHFAWTSCQMNRNNRLGPGPNLLFNLGRRDVGSGSIHIGKDRPRASMLDHIHCGCKGKRCRDDFIAWLNPNDLQRERQCSGTGIHRHGVARAGNLTKYFLETNHFGTAPDPTRSECVHNFEYILLQDKGTTEDKKIGTVWT